MNASKSEKALKGVGQLLLSRLASKAITFAFLIAYVRLLSREELAILPLYYVASGASVLLFSFGIPATLVREVPRLRSEDSERMYRLLFTGFTFVLVGILITATLALTFHAPIKELFFEQVHEDATYQLIIVGMVIGGWHILMSFILKSLQEYKDLAVYNASYDMQQRTFGLFGYLVSGIDGLLIGFLLAGLISNIWFTKKFSKFIFSSRKPLPIWSIIRFSWPFYIEGYLHYFRNNGDILFVGSVLGPSALAVFYVAKRLYDILMMVARSIEDVIAPSLSQLLGENYDTAIKGYSKVDIIAPAVLIPMGMLAAGLSYTFVDVIGGAKYVEQAFMPAAAFCLVAFIEGMYGIQARAIFVFGKPAYRLQLVAIQAAIYFPLLLMLITKIGIIGAPIAQAISFIIGFILAKWIIQKIIHYNGNHMITWKIFAASIVGLAVLVVIQISYYSVFVVPFYFISAAAVIAFLFMIFATEAELQMMMVSLPTQLRKSFCYYKKLKNKLRPMKDK